MTELLLHYKQIILVLILKVVKNYVFLHICVFNFFNGLDPKLFVLICLILTKK